MKPPLAEPFSDFGGHRPPAKFSVLRVLGVLAVAIGLAIFIVIARTYVRLLVRGIQVGYLTNGQLSELGYFGLFLFGFVLCALWGMRKRMQRR